MRRLFRHLDSLPRHPRLEIAIISILLVGLSFAYLAHAHRSAVIQAENLARNLTSLLAEQTEAAFLSTDIVLRALADDLATNGYERDNERIRLRMMDLRDRLNYARAIYVIGPDGFIIHDTDYPDTPNISLADRPYFTDLKDAPQSEIYVGEPLFSRSVFRWFVPVARRFKYSDGSFGGVIVAAVEPRFIEATLSRLSMGEGDAVALFHVDGTLIARSPSIEERLGQKHEDTPLFKTWLQQTPSEVHSGAASLDGTPSVIGHQRLSNFPLVVTVALENYRVLENWRSLVWFVILMDVFVISLITLFYMTLSRRRLKAEVHQQRSVMQEKIETIGFMTSGVAHDFKNILAAIQAGLRMMRRHGSDDKMLDAIEDATERGLSLTTDLLSFAKDHEIRKRVVECNQRVNRLNWLVRQAAGSDIMVDLELANRPLHVSVSPSLLDAALINLAVNASQAMRNKGSLKISTEVRNLVADGDLKAGEYAVLAVKDDGPGIPKVALDVLFQPFVTTKGAAGTGLGLFQTRRFARNSGGDIRVKSAPGEGTLVEILLPILPPDEARRDLMERDARVPRYVDA